MNQRDSRDRLILSDHHREPHEKLQRSIILPNGYCNNIRGNHGILYKKDPITGTEIVMKHNSIIAPGARFTACNHWGFHPSDLFLSYNEALGLENSTPAGTQPTSPEQVYLWCVGTDGCNLEDDSQVYPVNYKKWIAPESLVPFIYSNTDISEEDRNKYFGRKVSADKYIYYFKGFETEPVLYVVYEDDGTPVDVTTLYSSSNPSKVNIYAEANFKIFLGDCRDYLDHTVSTNPEKKINTISILTAWKQVIDGHTYYQNIQPLTKLNIENEKLRDLTKGIEFIYRIFY